MLIHPGRCFFVRHRFLRLQSSRSRGFEVFPELLNLGDYLLLFSASAPFSPSRKRQRDVLGSVSVSVSVLVVPKFEMWRMYRSPRRMPPSAIATEMRILVVLFIFCFGTTVWFWENKGKPLTRAMLALTVKFGG